MTMTDAATASMVFTAGAIAGTLLAYAVTARRNRESVLQREHDRQAKIIEDLLNEINRISRRPINLKGSPDASEEHF